MGISQGIGLGMGTRPWSQLWLMNMSNFKNKHGHLSSHMPASLCPDAWLSLDDLLNELRGGRVADNLQANKIRET